MFELILTAIVGCVRRAVAGRVHEAVLAGFSDGLNSAEESLGLQNAAQADLVADRPQVALIGQALQPADTPPINRIAQVAKAVAKAKTTTKVKAK
jgi:hypothetical protein